MADVLDVLQAICVTRGYNLLLKGSAEDEEKEFAVAIS